MRVDFQSAFVLHTRVYGETSLLLELFTEQHGRIAAIARGVRTAKSKTKGLLMPFIPLSLCWSGKTALVNLGKVEPAAPAFSLSGSDLLSGFYLNELLLKLLQPHDAHPAVFASYKEALAGLAQQAKDHQAVLRLFEKQLLKELGFGMLFNKDVNGAAIESDAYYYYQHECGLVRADRYNAEAFSGKSLLALYQEQLSDPLVLAEAKKLMRQIFACLLDGRQLKSRKFFTSIYE